MINQQLIDIKSTMQFYRDYFRLGVKVLLIFLAINFILITVIVYKMFNQPMQHFFVTTTSGNLVELKPSDRPIYLPATS